MDVMEAVSLIAAAVAIVCSTTAIVLGRRVRRDLRRNQEWMRRLGR